ncbi:MAG TPA: hypothetical protein VGR16_14220, partial [Thermomicrobiales bacterium]|nr:hypothetical protein [Thermomicrobiales bacterium]
CYSCGMDLRRAEVATGEVSPRTAAWGMSPSEVTPVEPRVAEEPARRKRSPWLTGCLAVIALLLLLCVGFFVWGLTPTGQEQLSELGTWAAREATEQAGSE